MSASTQTKQSATPSAVWLEDYAYFDGIGRAKRAGRKESATQWSVKETEYDALGRVYHANNPYFAANLAELRRQIPNGHCGPMTI